MTDNDIVQYLVRMREMVRVDALDRLRRELARLWPENRDAEVLATAIDAKMTRLQQTK